MWPREFPISTTCHERPAPARMQRPAHVETVHVQCIASAVPHERCPKRSASGAEGTAVFLRIERISCDIPGAGPSNRSHASNCGMQPDARVKSIPDPTHKE